MTIKIVIDAKDYILGRLASFAAKQAILGKSVVIVNCDDVIVAGNRANIIDEYYRLRKKGGSSLKGPFFPKEPYRIVKRTVRGMLQYKLKRGADALKRVICYNNTPAEYENVKKITSTNTKTTFTIKLSELATYI